MAAPFVPIPVPISNSASGNMTIKSQRSSSLGSTSTSSNSSKEPPDEPNPGTYKKLSVPDRISCSSSVCTSPLVRTKFDSSVEYCTQPNSDESASESLEERPSTPTILGYEVMEERAKFTLKEMFPGFRLALPPKRWFKDNYEYDFLEERQLGLQAFLQNLVAHKDIANCAPVRLFLCLDDPPGPFDSLEESRAFCETLEETNYRLQRDLVEKQKELEAVKKLLNEKKQQIEVLESQIQQMTTGEGKARRLSGEESECSGEVESSAIEADQSTATDNCSDKGSQENCWSEALHADNLPEIEVAEFADPDEVI
ncbi:sorting nexin-16 isoform X2 [Xenopus laevis]|uniref:Sorting nexin-16 isoform X2 n=1 Tax=Xenopus laevis TaxID=8355 RepID=A0A8J1L1M6_XENLA|nr:sorting nexin-16 isoform X2 [Xenopus laevis]